MLRPSAVVAFGVAFLARFVAAQSTSTLNFLTLDFNPDIIDLTMRNQWCNAQFNTCNILCGQATNANTCNGTLLTFDCLCKSNNSEPGLQYYTQTLPTFICEENLTLCKINATAETQSAAALQQCEDTEKAQCGQIDATNLTFTSSSTTSASSTPTGTTAGTSATSSSSKAAGATMAAMRNLGTGAFAAGAGVVFAALL